MRAYPATSRIFWVPPIISGTGKTIEFKFGQYIHGVYPNKSPLFFGKEAWAYPGTAQIFWIPLLSQEWVKLRTSNFVRTFLVSIGTKAHHKNVGKNSRRRTQGLSKFFRSPMYWVHRTVIFAIAQLSCISNDNVTLTECFYQLNSFLHNHLHWYLRHVIYQHSVPCWTHEPHRTTDSMEEPRSWLHHLLPPPVIQYCPSNFRNFRIFLTEPRNIDISYAVSKFQASYR